MTDRKLHLGYDDAKTLWELGALTEDRSDEEHNVLLRLARFLDAQIGPDGGHVAHTETTRDSDD